MSRPGPADDFYRHVNHAWLTDPEISIPPDQSRWGGFVQLADEGQTNQIALLQALAARPLADLSDDERPLALIWNASMARFDAWKRGEGDYAPLRDELAELASQLGPERDDDDAAFETGLARYLSRCQELGIRYPLSLDKEANLEDSKNVVMDMSPAGLSLPSRDYYLEPKFAEHRGWFSAHLQRVQELVGPELLESDFAERVLRFETKLAQITMKSEQARQFDKFYTLTTLDDVVTGMDALKALPEKLDNFDAHEVADDDPDADLLASRDVDSMCDAERARVTALLETLFEELGLRETLASNFAANYPGGDAAALRFRVMVFDGDYMRRVFKLLLRKHNRADLRAYLQYRAVASAADVCTQPLNDEFFDMFARKLRGQAEHKSPEKRTVGLVNSWVDMLMSKVYVAKYFSEADKAKVQDMIKDVLAVMERSLKNNDWLTETTKAAALDKLDRFTAKIGYPDKWKRYDALVASLGSGDSLFAMQQKVSAFEFESEFKCKVNAPKDKTEWSMPPNMVNACFHPLMNDITFPAAIIQPPFYYPSRADIEMEMPDSIWDVDEELVLLAANLGGIGAVIAHEITHGFDDQGRKFDAEGNVREWWTPEDAELFASKTRLMAAQAAGYKFTEPESRKTHTMSPELTMGENLADLGGMSLGFQALAKRMDDVGLKDKAQRRALADVFFRSWAVIWKSKETPQFAVQALAADPHAPPSFRANLCKNIDAFYEVYGVSDGDAMFLAPAKRVKMW